MQMCLTTWRLALLHLCPIKYTAASAFSNIPEKEGVPRVWKTSIPKSRDYKNLYMQKS
jgi:hypothetical protein